MRPSTTTFAPLFRTQKRSPANPRTNASPLVGALRGLAARGALVTSVHPMFGPDTDLLSGRHVLFMDAGSPEAVREAGHSIIGNLNEDGYLTATLEEIAQSGGHTLEDVQVLKLNYQRI